MVGGLVWISTILLIKIKIVPEGKGLGLTSSLLEYNEREKK